MRWMSKELPPDLVHYRNENHEICEESFSPFWYRCTGERTSHGSAGFDDNWQWCVLNFTNKCELHDSKIFIFSVCVCVCVYRAVDIYKEVFSRHRPVMNIFEKNPVVAVDTFVAPNASIIGQVRTKKWNFISSEIIYILIV